MGDESTDRVGWVCEDAPGSGGSSGPDDASRSGTIQECKMSDVRYSITVNKITAKDGNTVQRIDYNPGSAMYGANCDVVQILTVDLTESEWKACKRAIIEAKE